jgi:glycosyltransferase involved in cell wall biosynthesis
MTTAVSPVIAAPAIRPGHGRVHLVKFVAEFGNGGTERQFTNLAVGLDAERFHVEFGCLRLRGALADELRAHDIAVREYPIRSFYDPHAPLAQLRFARQLRRDEVDVVHAYNFYGNVFAVPAARLAGVPAVVASIRDMGVYLNAAQRRAQRWACRLADRVLVNAEAVRRWLVQDGYDESRISVIPNGIDLARFESAPAPSTLRAEYALDAGTPVVLLVSRLVPRKGIEHFLEAAARVLRQIPEARFVIVGEPATPRVRPDGTRETSFRAVLEAQAARLGVSRHVVFTGLRRDIPALMAEAAVSVLPSLSEGLSNVLLESMAMGAPVVATRVGGAPEVIEHGVSGLLVPPGAPAELARAIVALHPPRPRAPRLGRAARGVVTERYSLERMVHDTTREYHRLLDHSSRRRAALR